MTMTDSATTGYGATLRKRREQLGLSLDDVAASTRVRKTYLLALEEERLQVLPGKAYAIGFLRIYARQLGLPIEPLLEGFDDSAAGDEDEAALPDGSGRLRRSPKSKRPRRGRLPVILLGLLILMGAGYAVYRNAELLGIASRPGEVVPAATETPLPTPPAPAVPVAAPPEPPAPASSEAAVTELPVLPLGGAVVRMVPVAAGRMKVSLDGQETREYELQPDQPLNWKAMESLAVELSATGLVRIWVEQEELPAPEGAAFVLIVRPSPERRP